MSYNPQAFGESHHETQSDIVKSRIPGLPAVKTEILETVGLDKSFNYGKEELAEFLSTVLRSRPTVLGFEYRWGTTAKSTKNQIELPIDVQSKQRTIVAKALAELIDGQGMNFVGIKFEVIKEGHTETFLELLEGGLAEEDLKPSMKITYRPING